MNYAFLEYKQTHDIHEIKMHSDITKIYLNNKKKESPNFRASFILY